ncbi:hypothetical protein [uncultured Cohaesibacter sp.]|uniref:hypothetical protein n=1 Tax=uncultured Cohaesibacter sp. TaxID=1002546 RepID=UPI0029C65213|nr:hypothetical protein [uncultured Cohaesibacter sp.]
MKSIISLATGEPWPLAYDPIAVDFRALGRHLAARPWMFGMMHPDYSYADHLINLAAVAPRPLRLDALLIHAHMALTESPLLIATTDQEGKAKTTIMRAPFPETVLTSLKSSIRHAAELHDQMPKAIEDHLWDLEKLLTASEMHQLKHRRGMPDKDKIHPRTKEVAAAEWADQVEQRIPRIMAMREAG